MMRMETTAVFRSVDQHTGEVRSSKFFEALASADDRVDEVAKLKADNYRLASRIEVLEAELKSARTARDHALGVAAMARGTR